MVDVIHISIEGEKFTVYDDGNIYYMFDGKHYSINAFSDNYDVTYTNLSDDDNIKVREELLKPPKALQKKIRSITTELNDKYKARQKKISVLVLMFWKIVVVITTVNYINKKIKKKDDSDKAMEEYKKHAK